MHELVETNLIEAQFDEIKAKGRCLDIGGTYLEGGKPKLMSWDLNLVLEASLAVLNCINEKKTKDQPQTEPPRPRHLASSLDASAKHVTVVPLPHMAVTPVSDRK
jgi:hypothetical protein